MDVYTLLAAFGGGVFGAAIGALPVFILTGVFAIVGGLIILAGVAGDYSIPYIAFGAWLGPHVTFAGGVAAAAFAANKSKVMANGADITVPLYSTGYYGALLVGGIFGMLGSVIVYFLGAYSIPTDHPGCVVFILAIITRLTLGSSGFCGVCPVEDADKRPWFTGGTGMINHIILGFGIGAVVCGVGQTLLNAGINKELLGIYPVVCFGISATSLIFAQMGGAIPASHHITLPSALAFVLSGSVVVGILVAIINVLFGDFIAKTFNSYCDTHIDPPATVICITVLIINLVFA